MSVWSDWSHTFTYRDKPEYILKLLHMRMWEIQLICMCGALDLLFLLLYFAHK